MDVYKKSGRYIHQPFLYTNRFQQMGLLAQPHFALRCLTCDKTHTLTKDQGSAPEGLTTLMRRGPYKMVPPKL